MGLPMAKRLCAAGHSIGVWNRSPGKADGLAALGATVHLLASDAVKSADIVVSVLESGPVVEDVLFNQGVASSMTPGALFIDMASIKPREARDHAARLGALGMRTLTRPYLAACWALLTASWSSWWAARWLILSARSRCLHTLAAPRL